MVHLFERGGLKLALDVGSGAVHVLDDLAFSLLGALSEEEIRSGSIHSTPKNIIERYEHDDIADCLFELSKLLNSNLLYANDDYDEFKDELGVAPVKAMCLHMAHDCNLRCRYCFASTGGFGGQRMLMNADVAKKSIDLLIASSGERRNLEVDFFGGEPLMNFKVVKQTVDYAKKAQAAHNKNFRFTITTNGLLLNDDIIQYINAEMGNVVLSLDGRRDVNDKMRPCIDGSSSFDVIVPKYRQLVAQRGDKEYYVRGTYTKHNLDFAEDVLELHRLGFDQISVEPVVGPETDSYAIQDKHIGAIEASYEQLLKEMTARRKEGRGDFNFFHFMLDLDNGPCAIKRLKGCGSGNEYLAVTPDGDLYPCHQFVGNTDFLMGNVYEGILREDLREHFANTNLLSKTKCGSCWAKFFCSGGCNANNFNYAGSVLEPHALSCELEKIRLECAIALQAAASIPD